MSNIAEKRACLQFVALDNAVVDTSQPLATQPHCFFLKEMKARRLLPLFVSSIASHFRAGSVTFTQSENPDELFVERTRAWRLEAAGYGREGCTQEHIANKTPAGDGPIYEAGAEMCTEIATNTSCGRFPATYVVTDVENSLEPANNYCYGYKKDVIKKAREYSMYCQLNLNFRLQNFKLIFI